MWRFLNQNKMWHAAPRHVHDSPLKTEGHPLT